MDSVKIQNESIRKTFLQNVSLGMLSMIGQALFILADTFFIANGIGAEGIAALNIVLPVVNIVNGIGWMMGVGGATLYSASKGRGQIKKSNEYFSYTIVLTVIIGVLFILTSLVFAEPILTFLGASGDIYSLSRDYYEVFALFSIFFMLNNMFITFLRNDGNAKLAMIGFSFGGMLNIILDYLFIFPLNMGIRGAAIATVISPIVSLLILTLHRKNKNRTLAFTRFTKEIKTARNIVALGFSSFLNEFSSALVMFLFNIVLLNLVGDLAVSAYAIIANMNIIAIAIFTGIGQGMQPLASISFGLRNKRNGAKILKYSLITSTIVGTALFLIGLFFSEQIVALFNSENNVQLAEIAESGLRLYFSSFLFTGINFTAIYFFAAVQRSRSTLIISLLRGLVLVVPVLLLMMNSLDLTGIWLTMPIVEVMTVIVSVAILIRYRRRFLI